MRSDHRSRLLGACVVLASAVLAGCAIPAPYTPPPQPAPVPAPPPTGAGPQVETLPEPVPETVPLPEPPVPPPVRQRTLNPAATALLAQAQSQSASGNHAVAAATIERALRIEPDSPQLWIELGRIRLAEGNAAQAENMGRKALSEAAGDPRSQSAAWRLIADSYRVRERVQEAQEAEARASTLAPL